MLTVEGREQVLLKVSVVEMERNIIKQFGVDLGALINSGSFAFAALSKLPFPIGTTGRGLNCAIPSQRCHSAGEAWAVGKPRRRQSGRGRRRRPMVVGGKSCADDSACS